MTWFENTLGEYLRTLRNERRLTMRETSELAGVTQGYISQIENGLYIPSARTLSKLAAAYNTDEIELFRLAGVLPGADPGTERTLLERTGTTTPAAPGQIPPAAARLLNSRGECIVAERGLEGGLHGAVAQCNADPLAFVLEVGDGALEPVVRPGDWVVVSPASVPAAGHVAVVQHDGEYTLRRCTDEAGVLALRPLQTGYPSWRLPAAQRKVTLVGRAIHLISPNLTL